jgi:hypothetical protein
MAKIHEIDQALFAEEEKRTMITEIGIFKDRLLDSYRWYIAVADNEKIKVNIRMQARRDALDIALALLVSERHGLKIIERIQQEGYRLFRDS